jgi:peptide/nickel transport system permease protein
MEMHQGQSPTFADAIPLDETRAAEQEEGAASRRTRLPGWFPILWRNRKCRVGLLMLAGFALVAIFAPLVAPYDPGATSFPSNLQPTRDHPLGTTTAGEDILSQTIFGARTSLIVGLVAGLLATAIALVIGLTAGYRPGPVDDVLSFVINVALVVPVLPLIAIIAAYAPVRGIGIIVLFIGITGWAYGARMKRAQIVTLRTRDYITAAIFAGDRTPRIIFREIMPNMLSLVVAGYMGAATGAIGAEAGLAFLGLGDPTTVSWGTMLYWADNAGALLTGQWTWLLAPGLCLSFVITALTLVNFGVDALSNPHLRDE